MQLPDYRDTSIINLMSSIAKAYKRKTPYKALPQSYLKTLSHSKNIVLVVIDGLGYEYLKQYGKGSIFAAHLKGKLTCGFPSTTAASITSFHTGLAVQQHAITGWYVHLKELGAVTAILPLIPRFARIPLESARIRPEKILDQKPLHDRFKADTYVLLGNEIINSGYTKVLSGKAKRVGYKNLADFFGKLRNIVQKKSKKRKKFVYAYWPEFDSLCHSYGTTSKKVLAHFRQLDRRMKRFLKTIEGTDTTIIITADHGLIDVPSKKRIILHKHPKLEECLTLPLCGESRAAYCYVHPSKTKQFTQYVKQHFKRQCEVYKSETLVKKGYFGLGKPHPKLSDRIGDYVLVMKENYAIKDFLVHQKQTFYKAVHGGLSDEEMLVPLIVIECNTYSQIS